MGRPIADIQKQLRELFVFNERSNPFVTDKSPVKVYRTRDLTLFFEDELLTQIGLTGDYKGKLNSNLGLDDLVCDFEKVYGQMVEGDEDELTFKSLSGLCFEVDDSKYNSDNWTTEIPKLPVTEIYVFKVR